ncbi:fimbria/pilus periplasmic chaperone [Acinetobacter nematophilus]|uniref:Fimbria/pilus periplasmic chaperone n=1 Tax=Acinetobacter nematophilus TaxID=2994642 RepID=A0A9X3DWB9_9GAMM|nr:fimbria/pilus periplasmic chaperone [Acinetobacter nematophilus]MCX5469032.1 fimbria/pilus periplasmic chaperone [Acinetobacter nematophilus]
MNLNILKQGLLAITLGSLVSTSFADTSNSGGISLGATRVIYPVDAKQVSLPIINSNSKDRFLINAWIENKSEEKTKDFLITPPLFVAEAGAENTLRIINVAPNLPQDRESVFWINVKAIPSIDKSALTDKNILQLAILSRIKLFVRPSGLTTTPESALEKLKFSKSGESITVDNPSPYHVSFVNVYLDKEKLANVMAVPFSKTKISNSSGNDLSYQTVNDFGGLTPTVNLTLK